MEPCSMILPVPLLKFTQPSSNCLNCNIKMNLYFMRTYIPYNCLLKEEDVIKIDINFSPNKPQIVWVYQR